MDELFLKTETYTFQNADLLEGEEIIDVSNIKAEVEILPLNNEEEELRSDLIQRGSSSVKKRNPVKRKPKQVSVYLNNYLPILKFSSPFTRKELRRIP